MPKSRQAARRARPEHPDDLLMSATVAKMAGVSREAVRVWHRDGLIKTAHRTFEGIRLFRRADVEPYILERRQRRAAVESAKQRQAA